MRALPARRALPANAGGQGNQGEAGPGKLIGRRLHVDVATLAEDDEVADRDTGGLPLPMPKSYIP